MPMDQALEKQYNKPAKGPSGVIGFSRKKAAVCKWNLIKHKKYLYTDSLEKICSLNSDDEYSHHEFSQSITEVDKTAVDVMIKYISEHCNPFDAFEILPKNLVTGEQLKKEKSSHHLKCVEIGEEEHRKFKAERLEDKSVKLFDKITNVKLGNDSKKIIKCADIKKETIEFMQHIDIARMRNYDISYLLQHEITPTSFFLTKDGMLRKSQKSELTSEIKKLLPEIPKMVVTNEFESAAVINFMAYSRKVPIKKLNLHTYKDFWKHLWTSFQSFSKSTKIDIVFDIYLDGSIKQKEPTKRGKEYIETTISSRDQNMPVEIDKFWGSSSNKIQLQQVFILWVLETYRCSKPLFLGGANKEDLTSCFKIMDGVVTNQRLLKCTHEEVDDRLLFYANQDHHNCFTRY